MKWRLFFGMLFLCLPFTPAGFAGHPITCGCPDDYCPKAFPAIHCPPCCPLPDVYCPKCLPAVPCRTPCLDCDDYCPKHCPILLAPSWQPWYTCGPPERCFPCCIPWKKPGITGSHAPPKR